jgi:hypothetical protein
MKQFPSSLQLIPQRRMLRLLIIFIHLLTSKCSNDSSSILIISAARSGSTLVGESFNRLPNTMYFFEPCRSLEGPDGNKHFRQDLFKVDECVSLISKLFACEFSSEETSMLFKDIPAVFKSKTLRSFVEDERDVNSRHTLLIESCQKSSMIVIKEVS